MKKLLRRLLAMSCALLTMLTPACALSVEDAIGILKANYVDALPAAANEAKTMEELFTAVGDPYTFYMDPKQYAEFNNVVESETSVTGIGASIEYTAEGMLIGAVLSGGGAKDAGLEHGDLIIAIDGTSCAPAGDQFRSMVQGEPGTYVTLTVKHPDGTIKDYRIERRQVEIHNTQIASKDGVTTIDCDSFGSQTGKYFSEGIEKYEAETRVWVVDLRSNAGGLANVAVETIGYFTGFGPKLFYRERGGHYDVSSVWENGMTQKPVIVVVDGGSASASEVFASCVRAAQAGIVLGTRTFGKGTAQTVYNHENMPSLFNDDSLKVTTSRFYCADRNTTDKIGVIPTLYVDPELIDEIVALLTEPKPVTGDYYQFTLNRRYFYISAESMRNKKNRAAMTELLSALPPDATVGYYRWNKGAALVSPDTLLKEINSGAKPRRFTDLGNSACQTEIDTLGTYGIVMGENGRFNPKKELTRAELCAMLAQTFDLATERQSVFTDVAPDSWFHSDVSVVSGLGLINGVGGGRFDPNGTLTQEQFITVMGRLVEYLNLMTYEYESGIPEDLSQFEELARLSPWARVGAAILTDFGALTDAKEKTLLYTADLNEIDPKAPVTREQAAVTLYRIMTGLGIIKY